MVKDMRFSVVCGLLGYWLLGTTLLWGQGASSQDWIDFSKTYYKIKVANDGVYRVSKTALDAAGLSVGRGSELQLWHQGQEVPIFTSQEDTWGELDYFEFFGQRNGTEVERILFSNPDVQMLNDQYSLFTDTAAYFLTIDPISTNKRFVIKDLSALLDQLQAESHYMHEELLLLSNAHYQPTYNGTNYIKFSNFSIGEGFGGGFSRNREYTINTTKIFSNSPHAPTLRWRVGSNGINRNIKTFQWNGRTLLEHTAQAHGVLDTTVTIGPSEILASNRFRVSNSGTNDQHTLAHLTLRYPRSFDANNQNEFFLNLEAGPRKIVLENFNHGGQVPRVIDIRKGIWYEAQIVDGKLTFVVDGEHPHQLHISSKAGATRPIASISERKFIDFRQCNPNYLIISSKKLYQSQQGGQDFLTEYANYRGSAMGGGYQVTTVFVEDLYDQFGYGLDRHLACFRHFTTWITQNWPQLSYALIIGKGREYQSIRTTSQLTSPLMERFFVPTFGDSPSDILLFSEDERPLPILAVGRIAVKNMGELGSYLEKVRTHEAALNSPQTIDKLWQKRVLHLGGGGNANEQQSIRFFLNQMRDTLSQGAFGADVVSFYKTSTAPLQEATSQAIINTINAGVSMITFFGHSAVGTFDFSLEQPSRYQNMGKLPLIISLGCYSGNIHTPNTGLSEDFVLEPDRGALAFIAASGTAYLTTQGDFGRSLYQRLSGENYGETVGEIMQSIRSDKRNLIDIANRTLYQQLTLHGDPALRINNFKGPDYILDYARTKTIPEVINSGDRTFEVEFEVVNLGRGLRDSLELSVILLNEDSGVRDTVLLKIAAPPSKSTHRVSFDNNGQNSLGNNRVFITLDPQNKIAEVPNPFAELNNELVSEAGQQGYPFFILDNAIRPLYPTAYGIVPEATVELIAASSNGFAPKSDFVFQIDTTAQFDSPLLKKNKVTAFGGLVSWKPEITLKPGITYYWRVSPDSISPLVGFSWQKSSFTFLPESRPGWHQTHYYQWQNNTYDGLEIATDRKFVFDTLGFYINILNGIWDNAVNVGYQVNFENFSVSIRPWSFMQEGVAVAIGNRLTGSHRQNTGGAFGSINTTATGSGRCFGYNTKDQASRLKLLELLDSVEEGDFVYFFTIMGSENANFAPEDWDRDTLVGGRSIFTELQKYGAIQVTQLRDRGSVPYIFTFRKGGQVMSEIMAEDKFQNIVSYNFLPLKATSGSKSSTLVGPASKWYEAQYSISGAEAQDISTVDVLAVDEFGAETLVKSNVSTPVDLSDIDAQQYPFLKLRYAALDATLRTPPQLDEWTIFYEGYPDLCFDLNQPFTLVDSVQQGANYQMELLVRNLERYNADSLVVRYTLTDEQNVRKTSFHQFAGVAANGNQRISIATGTREQLGKYKIEAELNPSDTPKEIYRFNNVGLFDYKVFPDRQRPSLEVSFDGRPILDGDIISPNPLIKLSLKDENPYFQVDNPELIDLRLQYPSGEISQIQVSDPRIRFEPADNNNKNQAHLYFTPTLEDGRYKLIAAAKDPTGNVSGQTNYEVNFEVISKETISEVMNYPNPFSTSTQFVFTVTGTVPDQIRIQIMTVSGKVVREITQEELGPIFVGRNMSNFKWGGTDAFGEKLANGVYFYRVVTRNQDGSTREKLQNSDIEQYFKKGFGKMVILR